MVSMEGGGVGVGMGNVGGFGWVDGWGRMVPLQGKPIRVSIKTKTQV